MPSHQSPLPGIIGRLFAAAALSLVILCVPGGLQTAQAQTLLIGDEVPPLQVENWYVEEPDKEAEVRVVVFFDPTARDSLAALELVSALRPFHQDIEFLAVTGLDTHDELKQLVDTIGNRLGFPLGYDDDRSAWEGWVVGSRYFEVPAVFVVGEQGRLQWYGDPIRLEYVLTRIAEDSWDPYLDRAQMEQRRDLLQGMHQTEVDGDWDAAMEVLDRLYELTEDVRDPYAQNLVLTVDERRFKLLLAEMGQTERAYSFARRLMLEYPNEANLLNNLAWYIADEPGVPHRDLDLAMKLATRANELNVWTNPVHLDTFARVHFEMGNLDKAIEFQKLAVTLAEPGEPEYEIFTRALMRYEREAKAGANERGASH